MHDSTRRTFLALAGTSAVAGAALVAAPDSGAAPAAEPPSLPRNAEKSIAAYVKDTASGEVLLMSDGHEVTVTDRALVARLARAFDAAARSGK